MTLSLLEKTLDGRRLSPEEGLELLRHSDLVTLGSYASRKRFQINPDKQVTFVIDSNPNYTNVCEIDCIFCAFYRHPDEEDAYTYSIEDLIEKFKQLAQQGVTTVLLQGGVNPAIPFSWYLELVERTVKEVPEVHPHFFSTSEIIGMSRVAGISLQETLQKLWDAGLRTIPGGGAEILANRVKKKISHKKGTAEDWLEVMRTAHRIGYKTTATMMYGHLETDEEIIEHLESIRQLQDETGGFTAFIPWSFKPGNTPLEKIIPEFAPPSRYLQIIALSRLYLDNFPHIQASWFSEGKKIGQIALHFGADDFGGTLVEENVHKAANFVNRTTTEEVIDLIHSAGFDAAQRTTLYEILETFPLQNSLQAV